MTPLAVSLTSLLSFSGLACLCLSMDRHGRTLFHGRPSQRRDTAFRVAGWLFIALAFAAAVVTANWNFGSGAMARLAHRGRAHRRGADVLSSGLDPSGSHRRSSPRHGHRVLRLNRGRFSERPDRPM